MPAPIVRAWWVSIMTGPERPFGCFGSIANRSNNRIFDHPGLFTAIHPNQPTFKLLP